MNKYLRPVYLTVQLLGPTLIFNFQILIARVLILLYCRKCSLSLGSPSPKFLHIPKKACMCMLSHVELCTPLWTVVLQAPLSMGFSRQEYWSGLPCPPPGGFLDPGIELVYLTSALAGRFFTTITPGNPGSLAAAATSLQSCPALCDPIDSSPPGSPVPGILKVKPLEWVSVPQIPFCYRKGPDPVMFCINNWVAGEKKKCIHTYVHEDSS